MRTWSIAAQFIAAFGVLVVGSLLAAAQPVPALPTLVANLSGLEAVEMLTAIARGAPIGPGQAWFHAGQCRYDWPLLAARHRIGLGERIPRDRFAGPAEFFDRLDRNHDGVLSAADFDSSAPPMPRPANGPAGAGGPPALVLLKGLLNGEIGSPCEGPKIGDIAPTFTLRTPDGQKEVTLSSLRGKPVVLIFGSFT